MFSVLRVDAMRKGKVTGKTRVRNITTTKSRDHSQPIGMQGICSLQEEN